MIEGQQSQRTAVARRLLEEHGLRGARVVEPPKVDPRLSHSQERIWVDQQLAPYSSSYNCAVLMRTDGPLDSSALIAALRQIVERHAPLCSVIVETEEGPHWRRAALPDGFVRPLDLSETSDADENALADVAAALAAVPFDLTQAVPVRVYFARTGGGTHVLVLVAHHIAWDGVSTTVFFHELEQAYRGLVDGTGSALPSLTMHYDEYVAGKRERSGGASRDRLIAASKKYFADMPDAGALPADFKRIGLPDSRGARTAFRLDVATRRLLEETASASGGTLFHGLLALTASFIARQSGAEDVAVAVPVIDRPNSGAQALIGLFLDTVIVRVRVAPECSFSQLVGEAREAFVAAVELRDLPLGDIFGALAGAAGRVARPTIGVLLTLDHAPASINAIGGASVSLIDVPAHTARFDFGISFVEKDGELNARLEFATDLYSARSIEAYTERLARFIASAANAPDAPLADLAMLSLREKRYIARKLRGPRRAAASDPLARVLAAAAAHPNAPALSDGTTTLDYRELTASAWALAGVLRRAGVERGDVVALVAERHPRTVVALLSLWLAGATVAPVDPDAAKDCRLGNALAECGVSCVLGSASLLPAGSFSNVRTIALDGAEAERVGGHGEALLLDDPDAGAYLMFTTGSTGAPKPVLVRRKQLAETLAAACELFAQKPGARVLWSAALTFDIAFLEILLPLATGGCSVLHGATLDLTQLARQMEEVDVFHAVPSVMEDVILLAEQNPMRPKPTHPEVILVGGEAVTPKLLQRLRQLWPAAAVSVLYGPTEATIICASRQLRQSAIPGLPVIGSPHRNVALRITGERGTVAPVGMPGQLWIGGATVVDGYAGDRSAERFVTRRRSRWFSTGDRVRLTWDGDLEFLGRLDHQEKIRGVRVEPAVVENIMRGWLELADVVVAGADLPRIGRALIAYAVRSGRGEIDAVDVRERLAREVSAAAIPRHLVWLDALPKNRNGKVDRAALAAMAVNPDEHVGAPGYELEQTLACLWRSVLGRGPGSPDDSFYALGGDSLGAMRLLAQIRRVFGVSPAIDEILLHPTLRGMARAVAGNALPPGILTTIAAGPVAPTAAQLETLEALATVRGPGAPAREAVIRIDGDLDERCLRDAVNRLVERHDALRMRFEVHGTAPMLVYGEPVYDLTVAELDKTVSADEIDASACTLLQRRRDAVYDTVSPAPLRVVALRGTSRTYLALRLDVLAGDRVSLDLLVRELAVLYSSALTDAAPHLSLAPSFLSYADGESAGAAHPLTQAAVKFWTRRLSSSPAVPVRFGPDGDFAEREMRRKRIRFGDGGAQLYALAMSLDATELAVMLSVLARIVQPREQFPRVAVRTTNRGRPGGEALVGPLENTIYVDVDARGNPTFAQLVNRTMESLSEGYLYDGVPRASVVAACRDAGLSADALDTKLLCGWDSGPAMPSWGGASAALVDESSEAEEPNAFAPAGIELILNVSRSGDDLVIEATYDTRVLRGDQVERIGRALVQALTVALEDANSPADAMTGRAGNVFE